MAEDATPELLLVPFGTDAVLVEVADSDSALAVQSELRARAVPGVREIVPAARTVLVTFRPGVSSRAGLERALRAAAAGTSAVRTGAVVEIPVSYDGDDLDEVASLTGLTAEDVISRHVAAEYTVAFTGFAPGFGYLRGGDPALQVPRRAKPRTRVPAGAVGLAGEFSGIYPRSSPGGWQLIGNTTVALWDETREHPALLQPGTRVRFVEATTDAEAPPVAQPRPVEPVETERPHETWSGSTGSTGSGGMPALEILEPGLRTTLQDAGRSGHAHLGVPESGAMDRHALRRANTLLGNAAGRAALECSYGGLTVRAHGNLVIAVTGAASALEIESERGTRPAPSERPVALDDGERLRITPPSAGVYAYLAVRGGFDTATVLGSASSDTLSSVGPPQLRDGDTLTIGTRPREAITPWLGTPPALPATDDVVALKVILGPRSDWFTPGAVATLLSAEWTVGPDSDRVGARLRGSASLERSQLGELPSEGIVTGALQIPPDGQPILFLADHPVTGGYPVIACVVREQLDLAAQLPSGARVTFRERRR